MSPNVPTPARFRRRSLLALTLCLAAGAAGRPALAAEHIVRMVTESGPEHFAFTPALLLIEPGDTVRFAAASRLHGSKSIPGMIPAGGARWWGRMGQDVVVTFERPGVYGYKCEAHYAIGMVGLIVVGEDPPNLEAARAVRHPTAAQLVFDRLFNELGCRLRHPGQDCPSS
jgi:pseudoazurin